MRLEEAKIKLQPMLNCRLGELVTPEQMTDIIRAKGRAGQIIESLLGLDSTNGNLDFVDGELKTNKCDSSGNPLETMFITQISSRIDELLEKKDFYETLLYEKIRNLLYVPICKEGDPEDWIILPFVHVDLRKSEYTNIRLQIEKDYYYICELLKKHIETSTDGFIHTSSGELIQIRSKDSKPYTPIYSKLYKRNVSNKNHAFYFKKDFMRYINSDRY